MKTLAAMLFAAAVSVSLAGCETGYDHDRGYASAGYVDGYYDGFYGPFDGGYWGDDGFFWFRGPDHQFHRDDAHHFRRDGGQGFRSFHSQMVRPNDSDRHDDNDRR